MVITLDDFGLNKDVNREIYEWTQTKKVDFVSLLTNSSFTNEAIKMYKNDKKRKYKLGFHFNLIEESRYAKKKQFLAS